MAIWTNIFSGTNCVLSSSSIAYGTRSPNKLWLWQWRRVTKKSQLNYCPRGRSSSHMVKQNHRQHVSFHQVLHKQGSGQTVLGQQEEELMAKQAFWQSWLGALKFGTEKQTQHEQNLEIQTELRFLLHQSASRAIFGNFLIVADRKWQLIFLFVQTRIEPNC